MKCFMDVLVGDEEIYKAELQEYDRAVSVEVQSFRLRGIDLESRDSCLSTSIQRICIDPSSPAFCKVILITPLL